MMSSRPATNLAMLGSSLLAVQKPKFTVHVTTTICCSGDPAFLEALNDLQTIAHSLDGKQQ